MISESVEETKQIAENFLSQILADDPQNTACVVALSGDLGAGKTTFTQTVAALLGVKEDVVSPTFVIEKIYKIDTKHFSHLIHIDAYRIEDEGELAAIGFNDIVSNPKNLVFIEWPERIKGLLPKTYIKVSFKHREESGLENTREIIFDYEKK